MYEPPTIPKLARTYRLVLFQ